ncbi:hypothetical protein [Acinetobacter larvae]|uniref:Uncharacterized protein n=1 Tax=Acinetobacter larvae TaxID=1789224 RepID=A0A1B2LY01_9GAMM|nr:hypothetical protein [Acinetobacter larvae]AOA57805.1 hypothetical protein BFG52_05190 [Acinetobacter larvae]
MLKPMLLGLMLLCAIVVLALCWLSFKLLRQSQQQAKAAAQAQAKQSRTQRTPQNPLQSIAKKLSK